MTPLQSLKQEDLVVLRKATIFLRDKMLELERDIPLLKLLDREITLLNDELAARNLSTQEIKSLSDTQSRKP